MSVGTLVDLVGRGAERVDPSKTAVSSSESSVSFDSLLRGARGIAASLADARVGAGDRVGIWMDKTPRCVQVILGTLTAGAAYVPLDPRAPWRRCRSIAADCQLSALALDAPRLEHLGPVLEGLSARLVLVDAPGRSVEAPGRRGDFRAEQLEDAVRFAARDLPAPAPDDIAYILYTSGSTGSPKGVVHTHRSGLAFARWIQERFGIVREDVFSSHAPFHFDLSISDLYASLGAGASVRLISSLEGMMAPYLVRSVAAWGVTVWYSVPSILVAMLDSGGLEQHGFGRVRLLFFAGEVFPTPQLRRLRRALPQARLVNLFGPTETNVCTYFEVPAEIPEGLREPIPIGRACEHMETFVIDDDGREAGARVEGTLWVRGANLMQGYWNDPGRTTATLQSDPRGRPGLACCTGDRVRLRDDGDYEFLGRRDHMIKTRGYRVELGEIEAVLAAHPALLEAVAVALPDPGIGNRIVATVVPRLGENPEALLVRAFCRDYLPLYMIPERVEVQREIPRTSTGKADRTALREAWLSKETT